MVGISVILVLSLSEIICYFVKEFLTMEEIRIDCAHQSEQDQLRAKELAQLVFRLNHTMPMTEEYDRLVRKVFLPVSLSIFAAGHGLVPVQQSFPE